MKKPLTAPESFAGKPGHYLHRAKEPHWHEPERRWYDEYAARGADWILKTLGTNAGAVQLYEKEVLVTYFRESQNIRIKMDWLGCNGYTVYYLHKCGPRVCR